MEVVLRNNWFAPNGRLYKTGEHSGLPESWRERLPKSAKASTDDGTVKPPAPSEAEKLKEELMKKTVVELQKIARDNRPPIDFETDDNKLGLVDKIVRGKLG